MWPFTESWKDIAIEKRNARAAALKVASELGPSHAAYLSASGECGAHIAVPSSY